MRVSVERIFLIGLPGAGKSSIGRKLAGELDYEFIDADFEVSRQAGVDLAWIHDVEGESGLLKRERQLIERHTTDNHFVMALGGGVAPDTWMQQELSKLGMVVLLEVSLEVQLTRLVNEVHRPFLQQCPVAERPKMLRHMAEERQAAYRKIACYCVDTTHSSKEVTIAEIMKHCLGREDG